MTRRIEVEPIDPSKYVELRPTRKASERAMVSHLFTDDDYWWPYRSAACGREIAGDRLTSDRLDMVEMCEQCRKRAGLDRKGARDAAA